MVNLFTNFGQPIDIIDVSSPPIIFTLSSSVTDRFSSPPPVLAVLGTRIIWSLYSVSSMLTLFYRNCFNSDKVAEISYASMWGVLTWLVNLC